MAIGLGAKLARLLLLTFNFIFWLSGIGLIGVGIWLLVTDRGDVFSIIQPEGTTPMNKIAAYCVIGIGCFVVLVGFLGCCGAMHENRCMLVTYFAIVLVILLAEVVGGILLVIYKKQLEETLQDRLQGSLKTNYGVIPMYQTLTNGFNTIQKKHHCCGVVGPSDYLLSAWYNKTNSQADKDGIKEAVPAECCELTVVDGKAVAVDPTTCSKTGCFEAVKTDILQLHGILIGVGAGIAGLELLGMIFAICLCRNIDYDI